jgi:nitroreductase
LFEDVGDTPYTFKEIRNLDQLIPYDKLYNFLRAHRSIRHYKEKKVPKDILKKVITAMQYAPSGANLRAEKYAIISDPDRIEALSKAVLEELLSSPSTRSHYEESFRVRSKMYKNPVYFDAPHVIFVYASTDTFIEGINVGISVTYGRLAAQSLGLGTCWNGWTQMAFDKNKKLLKLAGIRGKGWGAFTIGYPDINYIRCPPRKQKKIKGLD